MMKLRWCLLLGFGSLVASAGCDSHAAKTVDAAVVAPAPPSAPVADNKPTEPPPPELLQPVDLWKDGKQQGKVDAQGPERDKYVFLDLGEGWTPILFTDGEKANGEAVPHQFRPTYLALARGEFPRDAYGERAKEDKYLELYGIMPTVGVLRERLKWARALACSKQLDLSALQSFTGIITYDGPDTALRKQQRFVAAERAVQGWLSAQNLSDPAALDSSALKDKEKALLVLYLEQRDDDLAIRALQERLECEGYFKGKGKWVKGAFDWGTHEALAEFERRHRVYSWGALGPARRHHRAAQARRHPDPHHCAGRLRCRPASASAAARAARAAAGHGADGRSEPGQHAASRRADADRREAG